MYFLQPVITICPDRTLNGRYCARGVWMEGMRITPCRSFPSYGFHYDETTYDASCVAYPRTSFRDIPVHRREVWNETANPERSRSSLHNILWACHEWTMAYSEELIAIHSTSEGWSHPSQGHPQWRGERLWWRWNGGRRWTISCPCKCISTYSYRFY